MLGLQNTELFSSRQKNIVLVGRNLKQLNIPFFPLCKGVRCIDALQGLETLMLITEHGLNSLAQLGEELERTRIYWRNSRPLQTVPDIDFGPGALLSFLEDSG